MWDLEVEIILHEKSLNKFFLDLDNCDISENGRKKWLKRSYNWFNKKNVILFVAEIDKQIVGILNGKIFKWKWSDKKPFDIARVGNLVVLKRYRQKGIASQLMRQFEEWARSKKINFIDLNITSKNKVAYNLYSKLGYSDYTLTMVKRLK